MMITKDLLRERSPRTVLKSVFEDSTKNLPRRFYKDSTKNLYKTIASL